MKLLFFDDKKGNETNLRRYNGSINFTEKTKKWGLFGRKDMKRVAVGQNRIQGKHTKSFIQNFIDFQIHDNNDNSYDPVKTSCQN